MLLPDRFTNKIAETFYSKRFYVLNVEDEIEADGGAKRSIRGVKSEFLGNIRFVKFGIMTADKGVVIDADAIITAPTETEISPNDIVQHLCKRYLVTAVNLYDSHLEIMIQKWPLE